MTTQEENIRFGIHKKTGVDIEKKERPTKGKLVYMHGSEERVLFHDEPFGFLQSMKQKLVREGNDPRTLKIKY